MIKVTLIKHPENFENREKLLQDKLNVISKDGGTILFITSDSEGYTIVYNYYI